MRSPGRLVLFALAGVLLVVMPALPARSDVEACNEAWAEVGELMREEVNEGLTAGLIDEINLLIPTLVECARWDADGDGMLSGVERWGPLVSVYFDSEDIERVLCLIGHESGGNPWAENPTSGAAGLMQVMPFWAGNFGMSVSSLFDPALNLQVASWIYDDQGWNAWSPYQRGLCH